METKKSKHADLEPKKFIFLQLGLIVALGLSLAAFEWETPVNQLVVNSNWESISADFVPINTVFENKKPPPVVPAPGINIVKNTESVTSDMPFDNEIKPDEALPPYIAPVPVQMEDEKSVADDIPFVSVQNMPEFPGGINALREFLAKNIEFPESASQTGREGTVYVYFVVEKDGSVSNIKTLRGIGGGCDEEAERVIGRLPKWKPGEQQGKKVRVSYTIPVIFKLN